MNRIYKKSNNEILVLITPYIYHSPDSSLLLGSWDDPFLKGFKILKFDSMNKALYEAFNHPDIDWYRIIQNHKPIYNRINRVLTELTKKLTFDVRYIPKLKTPEEFKISFFRHVDSSHFPKNDYHGIMTFYFIHPQSHFINVLFNIIKYYPSRHNNPTNLRINDMARSKDYLNIQYSKKINPYHIQLVGKNEFGTTYSIYLITSLFYKKKMGETKKNEKELIEMQKKIDF